ncbi:MAG: hypothetical protein CBD88_08100 [Flavobacteriales bacterium TMED228]|jgi:hypothetical protein|nr:MAG: hypothetical protein CBD88_08100 [Flavobacteriales bacterium TMED228]|tara:strand:+ start:769 stop:1014 length:246 start_codon:yes stop_codon:yes gene_type:complete
MPFTEQKASIRYEMINGSRTPVLTPETEVTLTNMKTGQEYFSDAEALADVQNKETDTKAEDIKRDVKIIVEHVPLGGDTKL